MVSITATVVLPNVAEDNPSVPCRTGIPASVVPLTIAVPFNDSDALERRTQRLIEKGRPPAAFVMEAALMNMGVVLPEPGYIARVDEITRRYGIVWVVDEVKMGLAIAAGGATEYSGLQPDPVTLARTLGGGLPSDAIGGKRPSWRSCAHGRCTRWARSSATRWM